jgi:hypothetical protein
VEAVFGVHAWLSGIMGAAAVAALAGALSGAVGVVVYRVLSDQERIRLMKQRAREIRGQLRNPDLEPRESVRLAMANLRHALLLLGKVAPPALAGGAVMLPAMFWLAARDVSVTEAASLLGGWEPPFFGGVLAGALIVKVRLKVE